MVDTAQKRTRTWLDTWIVSANLTKDDDATQVLWISAYDLPDYPLIRVFKDKLIELVWSIGQAVSSAIIDSDHYPHGYRENVPITIFTVDRTGITGIKLMAKAEAELRRIEETQPIGSLRRQTRGQPIPQRIGGVFLWAVEYTIEYVRDLT